MVNGRVAARKKLQSRIRAQPRLPIKLPLQRLPLECRAQMRPSHLFEPVFLTQDGRLPEQRDTPAFRANTGQSTFPPQLALARAAHGFSL